MQKRMKIESDGLLEATMKRSDPTAITQKGIVRTTA